MLIPDGWQITWEFFNEPLDDGDYKPGSGKFISALASTTADWRYLEATIRFDLRQIAEYTDEQIERVFVHECCHVLLSETRAGRDVTAPEWLDHEERVASTLANAFLETVRAKT